MHGSHLYACNPTGECLFALSVSAPFRQLLQVLHDYGLLINADWWPVPYSVLGPRTTDVVNPDALLGTLARGGPEALRPRALRPQARVAIAFEVSFFYVYIA
jgi:hypothetical protein